MMTLCAVSMESKDLANIARTTNKCVQCQTAQTKPLYRICDSLQAEKQHILMHINALIAARNRLIVQDQRQPPSSQCLSTFFYGTRELRADFSRQTSFSVAKNCATGLFVGRKKEATQREKAVVEVQKKLVCA